MSDQPPLAPHDPFGVENNLNEDNPRTPERRARAVSSFSPVPLISPPLVKYEGGADELPHTAINANNHNLPPLVKYEGNPDMLDGMSHAELELLA